MTLPPLWPHQQKALDIALNKYSLLFEPGCGKTRTALELAKKHKVSSVIIFAPLNVCRNWIKEIEQNFPNPTIYLCAGQTSNKKLEALRSFKNATTQTFLICNIEALRSQNYTDIIKATNCNFIIADEFHCFKNSESKQTKGLLSILKKLNPTYFYALTGTPCPAGEVDLYTLLYVMGKTNLNFFCWRKKYFVDHNERWRGRSGYFPDYKINASLKPELSKILNSVSMVVKKEEVLELPEFVRTSLYYQLSNAQRKNYESMLEYLFAGDDNTELTAANVLSRTLRLQQITAGLLDDNKYDDGRLKVLEDAIDIIDNTDRHAQFIIWTIFKFTYKQIGEVLDKRGITFAFLTGEQSAQERFENIEDFQEGYCRVLIAHPKAGGVGVNLTKASFAVYYCKGFSLTDDLQSEARNYRAGSEQHKKITRIDILAENTIDEDITEALINKKTTQDFIMNLKGKYGHSDNAKPSNGIVNAKTKA